jgi:phosphoenolpyruvate carboxylase
VAALRHSEQSHGSFAWTQTRFHLPVWLGFGAAFKHAIQKDIKKYPHAPGDIQSVAFLQIDNLLVEMAFAMGDPGFAALYDKPLVSE